MFFGQHPVYRMWHTSAAVAAQQNDNLHSCVAHVVRFMGIVVAQVCEAKGVPEEFVRLPVEQQEDMVSRLHPWVRLVVEGSDATQVSSTRGACGQRSLRLRGRNLCARRNLGEKGIWKKTRKFSRTLSILSVFRKF